MKYLGKRQPNKAFDHYTMNRKSKGTRCMKTLTITTITAMLIAGTVVAQDTKPKTSTEFACALQYYMPGEDDDYDSGFGAEAQVRFWQNQNLGFALAGGLANWNINEQEAVVSDGFIAVGVSIEGSVLLVPIGGSILFRPTLGDNLSLILECGLRYVVVESDVEVTFAAANAFGAVVGGTADIEIDNGLVGLIAANLEAELSPGFSLLGGVGYQFDIAKGDAKWMGEDLGENELKAFFIRAGLAINF